MCTLLELAPSQSPCSRLLISPQHSCPPETSPEDFPIAYPPHSDPELHRMGGSKPRHFLKQSNSVMEPWTFLPGSSFNSTPLPHGADLVDQHPREGGLKEEKRDAR